MPIDFPESPQQNDTYTSGNTTWQWNGTVWNIVTSASPVNLPNVFNTIAVSGQNSVVADSQSDTLTIVAGSNISVSTDQSTDTITISSTVSDAGEGVQQNLFSQFTADSGSTVANSTTDVLTVAGGNDISTAIVGDTLTINFTGSAPGTTFEELTDAVRANDLTIDQLYLPAITRLTVNNSGASAYLFDQWGGNNPDIYAISGTTIAFDLNLISGHPFLIQGPTGDNYDAGLVHVSNNGTVSTEENAQGKDSGTLYWKIPGTISGTYRYQCAVHAPMIGQILIKSFATL